MADQATKESGRTQIGLVTVFILGICAAAATGGLVANWASGPDVEAEMTSMELAATEEVASDGPQRSGFRPLDESLAAPVVQGAVYVPIYSSIYVGRQRTLSDLVATLSIRNTSASEPLIVTAVTYFDDDGKKLQDYLATPHELAPMGTGEFFVDRSDTRGGSGANFIVTWAANAPITRPLIEAVMLGNYGLKSISIVSRGEPLEQVGGGDAE